MTMWLVGAGYWGKKLHHSLSQLGVDAKIIDIKNNQSIKVTPRKWVGRTPKK